MRTKYTPSKCDAHKSAVGSQTVLQAVGPAWSTGSRLGRSTGFREAVSSAQIPAAASEGKGRVSF